MRGVLSEDCGWLVLIFWLMNDLIVAEDCGDGVFRYTVELFR